ncbi:hypothetical protein [Streptomyces sp. NBC_00572]|uniref:hypothetical protein n=1 Tax=Streptomyces sp. NBC_00572 TaxID=2903664 RepID=UPI0022576391|nr:hypothetical protein [Streptomyces sp. NBC_00572]MCX4983250.1 hypothetical protein [Streptomyces sp. NBC_00572]
MTGNASGGLGWELVGWETDDFAPHVTGLAYDEILRVRDLFPERDDELLETAVYVVPPERYDAMRAAVPRLEFRAGLEYQIGGFRLSASPAHRE